MILPDGRVPLILRTDRRIRNGVAVVGGVCYFRRSKRMEGVVVHDAVVVVVVVAVVAVVDVVAVVADGMSDDWVQLLRDVVVHVVSEVVMFARRHHPGDDGGVGDGDHHMG